MRNKYSGICPTCQVSVAAGAGVAVCLPAGWRVFCAAHDPKAPSPAVTAAQAVLATVIRVWMAAGRVLCAPVSRLGGDLFAKYLAATRGASVYYSPADGAQAAPLAQGAALVEALRAAGFVPDVAPDLQAQLVDRTAQATTEVQAARARMLAANAALATRGLALRGFQRAGVEWLAPRIKAVLADDMGLGKTIQVLCALPENAATVVVCPSVAKYVWAAELARFRPELTVTVIAGRGNFRWPVAGEVVIVNYDILPGTPATKKGYAATLPAGLVTAPAGVVLVADEAHALCSASSGRTSQFRALRDAAFTANGRVWCVTATPLANRPTELWALVQALGAGRETFGDYETYCRMWNAYQGRFGMEWGDATPAVAASLRKVMLRRLKRDVLADLPAKTVRVVEVDGLSASLRRLLDKALVTNQAALDAYKTANDTANGTYFEGLAEARAALATLKLGAAIDMVEEFEAANEPVVVFSAHRAPIDAFGDRTGWAVITGDVTPEKRKAIQDAFQAGTLRGVACTIKAAGVALTLTRATNALFIDEEWNPILNVQAQDRIYRLGTTHGVLITRLVAAHALDRHVARIIADKMVMIADSVDAARTTDEGAVATTTYAVDAAAMQRDAEAAIEAEVALLQAEKVAPIAPAVSAPARFDAAIDTSATECPF